MFPRRAIITEHSLIKKSEQTTYITNKRNRKQPAPSFPISLSQCQTGPTKHNINTTNRTKHENNNKKNKKKKKKKTKKKKKKTNKKTNKTKTKEKKKKKKKKKKNQNNHHRTVSFTIVYVFSDLNGPFPFRIFLFRPCH